MKINLRDVYFALTSVFIGFLTILIIINTANFNSEEDRTKVIKENENKKDILLFAPLYSGLSEANAATLASMYDMVIIHDNYESLIPVFRQANPDIKILLYKASFICFNPDYIHETINPNEDLPFQLNGNGEIVRDPYDDFAHDCRMPKYSSPEVKKYFVEQLKGELAEAERFGGFDGIFLDVIPLSALEYAGAQGLENNDSDADIRKGLYSFISYVNAGLGDMMFIPNYAPYIFIDNLSPGEFWGLGDGGLDEFLFHKYDWNPLPDEKKELQREAMDYALDNNLVFMAASNTMCDQENTLKVWNYFSSDDDFYLYPMCEYSYSAAAALKSYEFLEKLGLVENR